MQVRAGANQAPIFPAIDQETRPLVSTRQAAFYLLRGEQTLRIWASQENGPIRPVRVGRRLGWPMSRIRELVGQEGKHGSR